MAAHRTDVLVVGAGPVGLTAAAALAQRGVSCRVVDQSPGRTGTRCYLLWPRTLEALELVGVPVGGIVGQGVHLERKVFHCRGETHAHPFDEQDSAWPRPVSVPQTVTERALVERLDRFGVRVERPVRVTAVTQDAGQVTALLHHAGGVERAHADWLVVAQGVLGDLRQQLGIGWAGGTLPGVQVAHLDVAVPDRLRFGGTDEHIFLDRGRNVGLVPLPGGRHRLFATLPDDDPTDWTPPTWAELGRTVEEVTGIGAVTDLGNGWRLRPSRGIAATFRAGRCFLAGESAKVAPLPVHGMNGGIQDALGLAWRLAEVVRGRAVPELLDTYCTERRAVAEQVLAQTERILTRGLAADPGEHVLPRLRQRRFELRTQAPVRHPPGYLCQDARDLPGPRAGERMPDTTVVTADGARTSLFRLLVRAGGWLLLVAAGPPADPRIGAALEAVAPSGVDAHVVAPPGRAGPPGLYLVRPDGHLGFRGDLDDVLALRRYAARVLRAPSAA